MVRFPDPLQHLLNELTRLPGIGRRGAERLALHLLEAPPERTETLAEALRQLKLRIRRCRLCGNWSEETLCGFCADPARKNGLLCVVEQPSDLWAFEQADVFGGRYHVLGGTISPMSGITAEDLRIESLIDRIQQERISEVILATNPSVEGDATAQYLLGRLKPLRLHVSRIGLGVPLGAHLGYADSGTLRLALEGRRDLTH